jgi:flagellar basal-body rod protein FlgB
MSGISDAALMAALRRQMTIAVARQVATAGNLANVDTPGFKAREVKFDAELQKQLGTVKTTHPLHMTPGGPNGFMEQEVEGLEERRDGNNVQVDREMLAMGRAAGDFSAAQTVLAAKFRLVRYAINEGK